MDTQPTIEIDLKEFGDQSGAKVVLSEPTFRRVKDMKNEVRCCLSGIKVDKDNPLKPEDIAFGDLEIIALMAYVKIAPFRPTLADFLNYCDTLDEVKIGNAEALYNRMTDGANRLKSGELSPLPN